MNTTSQERNSWIQLAVSVTVILYYATKTFGNEMLHTLGMSGLIIQATLFAAIASAVGVLLNRFVLTKGKVERDEMDRLIESKAYRNAYFVAIGIAWWAITYILVGMGIESALEDSGAVAEDIRAIVSKLPGVIHTLFLGMFLTYSVFSGTQIFYYRRGGVL